MQSLRPSQLPQHVGITGIWIFSFCNRRDTVLWSDTGRYKSINLSIDSTKPSLWRPARPNMNYIVTINLIA
ncbi:MAG: hypothetical protein O4752_11660, partial [Trichodesmium sp. St4_bin8_1]|nr:hypothetical protein [Trichodesmium sp. St4_bin8_1]